MREIIKTEEYAFKAIYEQLEEMDFTDFNCSPLINCACGRGKTHAILSDEMYELFCRKLKKRQPQILMLESRDNTKTQIREKVSNPNIHIYCYSATENMDFSLYDIVIVDEIHSLFQDAGFAAASYDTLGQWLLKADCFQIFMTANELDFLAYAENYFTEREFNLTEPNLNQKFVRYRAKQLILAINKTKGKVEKIIEIKEKEFFEKRHKGIFFILTVADAYRLYRKYSEKGYRCGLYISRWNTTALQEEIKQEDETQTLWDYTSIYGETRVIDIYNEQEKQRLTAGLPTIRTSLISGKMPDDIDYLFVTDCAREGLDLKEENRLDFVFIEDFYPLSIEQKIFRYRGDIPFVYISLPKARLERIYQRTEEKLQEFLRMSPHELEIMMKERKQNDPLRKIIIRNKETKQFEVSRLYVAKIVREKKLFEDIYGMIKEENQEGLLGVYGELAEKVLFEDTREENQKTILENFFNNKTGELLTEENKEKWLEELKELGLRNQKRETDFSFTYVKKRCQEYEICSFKRVKIGKKEAKASSICSSLIGKNCERVISFLKE